MSQASDRADLRLVHDQNQLALRRLYDSHSRILAHRLLKMSSDITLVEEVLQDTFVVVWRNPGAYRGTGAVGAWLWGIARNTMLKRLKAEESFRRTLGLLTVTEDSSGSDIEDWLFSDELETAVGSLTPDQHRTLVLVHEGYEVNEIARIMEVAPGTVRTRMHRIRKALSATALRR